MRFFRVYGSFINPHFSPRKKELLNSLYSPFSLFLAHFFLKHSAMAYEERIFITGATGNIGKPLVCKLLSSPKASVTLYVRTPVKAQELFTATDYSSEKLRIVQGDLEDLKLFQDSITGHTRLFLLVLGHQVGDESARILSEKAYAAGVKQVVLISGINSSMPWRSSILTETGVYREQSILSISNRGTVVTLRPAYFMSNQLSMDASTVKNANKVIDSREPTVIKPWISPRDIGELAANVMLEPVEKHGDAVYEMIGESVTPQEHVEILTRVLGRKIVYEKASDEEFYKLLTTKAGMSHIMAWVFLQLSQSCNQKATPGLSILLGRAPETLEQWVEQNKAAFL
ncbi:hypothetical protein BDB00DRAFT_798511 [Zychaea mexicana]|uniref:uncharacterized protein n=1 Tax=Zychaea mexicana TaxID=64656 RepID=UPI0022FE11CB|nr:uncharacterized protein BDB00DRAFT_798511 [Zychaea mexicana]KAI9498570.1 hypothetical protein BDB00DRAFT_798511 [Zychaea mexicana]